MKPKTALNEIRLRSDEIDKCVECGLCQSVCPTYLTSGNEGKTARGKIAILRSMLDGSLEPSGSIAKLFDDCLTCYACQTVCPAGVKTERLWTAARQDLTSLYGYGSLKRLGLNWTIGKPGLLDTVVRMIGSMTGFDREDHNSARLTARGFPIFKGAPYLQTLDEDYPATGEAKGNVGLLLGCTSNLSTPWIADAVVRVLNKSGYNVVIPKAQVCCGAPAINNGNWEVARELARKNLDIFNSLEVDYIVSPDGTCAGVLKHDYSQLFHGDKDVQKQVGILSEKVIDLSLLLVRLLENGDLKLARWKGDAVTLHDSCHVTHVGAGSRWREILGEIDGLEIANMNRSEHCCGFGGSYAFSHPEESVKIAERKLEEVIKSGANEVLVGSPGCALRLQSLTELERFRDVRIRHVIELIEEVQV